MKEKLKKFWDKIIWFTFWTIFWILFISFIVLLGWWDKVRFTF